MPSPNKFAKLEEVGYHIAQVCGVCAHYIKGGTASGLWGHCALASYKHEAHGHHPLGVHQLGSCRLWECNQSGALTVLGSYVKLLPGWQGGEP